MSGANLELERVRRITSEALLEHLAAERIALEEFEERVGAVRRARSVEELRGLLAGLPGRPRETAVAGPGSAALPEGAVGAGRTRWLLSLVRKAELDLSDGLPPGVTVVRVACGPGGGDIVVPPGTTVEVGGLAGRAPRVGPELDRPGAGGAATVVVVRGFAAFGRIRVTAGDAP